MKSVFQFFLSSLLVFVFSSLFAAELQAQTKVPDPFCSPKDFFKYLSQKNKERVLYVVQKCPNVDLNENGPNKESFAETLAVTGWDDIFSIVIKDQSVLLENSTLSFIKNTRYAWLIQLADRTNFKMEEAFLLEALKNPTGSELFFQKLVDLKKIDLNNAFTKEPKTFIGATLALKAWNLYDYFNKLPNANLSETWAVSCAYAQVNSNKPEETRRYVQIQKDLLKSGAVTANDPCLGNTSPILSALRGGYDLELIDLLLLRPELSLASPGVSYQALEIASSRRTPYPEHVVTRILQNPTFNQNDKWGQNTLWNLLASFVAKTSVSHSMAKIIVNHLPLLTNVTINDNNAYLILIDSMISRADFAKSPIVELFFAQPNLNINQKYYDRSVLVTAAMSQNYNVLDFLLSKGVDTKDLGQIAKVSPYLVEFIAANTKYFDLFFDRADFNMNALSSSKRKMLLELVFLNETQEAINLLPRIYKDSRFDILQLGDFMGNARCPIPIAVSNLAKTKNLNAGKIPMELAALSTDGQLNAKCEINYYGGNSVQLAAYIGDFDLIRYLWKQRKVPLWISGTSHTAFGAAVREQRWDIMKFFLDEGYVSELNGIYKYDYSDKPIVQSEYSVLACLLESKKPEAVELAKKVIALPSFDPNVRQYNSSYWPTSLLEDVVQDQNVEIFNLLIQHPKIIIGHALVAAVSYYDPKSYNPIFFDIMLSKFKIKTDQDKEVAIQTLDRIYSGRFPLEFFNRVTSLANFDVNFPMTASNLKEGDKITLVASYLSRDENEIRDDFIQALFKFKNLNPSVPSAIHPIIGLLNSRASFETIMKYFNLYYSHPATVQLLPFSDAEFVQKLEAAMSGGYNRDNKFYIARAAAFFLTNTKLKLTKEHVAQFFEYRNWFSTYGVSTKERNFFLDAFFSSPYTKPYAQWSKVVADLKIDETLDLEFLKKHADKIDLNYKADENSSTLIERSVSYRGNQFFEFLVANPNCNITGLAEKLATRTSDPFFIKTLLEKRGQQISTTELLSSLEKILTYSFDLKRPPTEEVKALLLYLTNLDGLTKLTPQNLYRRVPLASALAFLNVDPVFQQLYQRIWKEDKTVLDQTMGLVQEMFSQKRWDLFKALVNRGYDLERSIEEKSLLTYAVGFKDLELLKYLYSKGVTPQRGCGKVDYYNRCQNSPFWQSLLIGWYDGADYLISIGADPNFVEGQSKSTLVEAMKLKNMEAIQYLLSKNVRVNGTGSLAVAMALQNDALVNLFLATKDIDANDRASLENRTTYPIIEAAKLGRIDYVRALLALPGVQKNIQDSSGYRAIDWAATNGFLDIVELLKKI